MKVIVTKNTEELAEQALQVMLDVVKNKPNAVIGLATGSSPVGLYKKMIEDCKNNGTSYANIKSVKECERYTALLNSMPQDIQLLGIGANGHIGFNEPNTPFNSTTHIVELEEGTRRDNARFFASLDEVPTHAITMGISNIMNAKKILVVANGANKAKAVYQMIKGEVSENCPASILQKHNDVVVVVDEAAYSLCK